MGIYDQRDRSAYSLFQTEPRYANNKHILQWWTSSHDKAMVEHIVRNQWIWYWSITDEIVQITPPEQLEHWKQSDPLCRKYVWYNVLMYFAASRAEQLGLTRAIRTPVWKTCPLCKQKFVEDSLPAPLIERLGIDHLDFCAPCLRDTVLQGSGDDSASMDSILRYLENLTSLLGRIPTQNFGEGKTDLLEFDVSQRLELLWLLKHKPTSKRVKAVFGSWLNALIHAGILEDGTRRTSRGIQTIAKDGHVCLSLGEKTIDDFLFTSGIQHDREPRYPEGNFRADFKVGDVLIEYFGLSGDPDYDAKSKKKASICKKHKITLIAIYPQDLISREKLERKLSQLLISGEG